ncbi:MAG: LysM peptidoglycan-binding domain-containing protein [Syntrophothermus sp.]
MLVAAGWWLAPRVYSLAITEHRREYRVVVVKEGDTLWSIAEDQLDHGMDPRQLIYEIRTINHLQSAIVKPGELLRIPVAMRL